jgi:hypothetical protein
MKYPFTLLPYDTLVLHALNGKFVLHSWLPRLTLSSVEDIKSAIGAGTLRSKPLSGDGRDCTRHALAITAT